MQMRCSGPDDQHRPTRPPPDTGHDDTELDVSRDDLTVDELLDEYRFARRYCSALVEALTADQLYWRPHEHSSAIAWHLGHQAAVAHYLVRNLTAAEPPIDGDLDRLFDSATPEPARGDLPDIDRLRTYRDEAAARVETTMTRIADGELGAPAQLPMIAAVVLRAVVNHEYQHGQWIREVRDTFTDVPAPPPESARLVVVDGYHVLG
jgi:DinB superfamily